MGYTSGAFSGRGSGQSYATDSFRIGKCKAADDWMSCSGGCNDYEAGGRCANNSPCTAGERVKITVACDGGSTKTSSCTGNEYTKYTSKLTYLQNLTFSN
jgi:hypothetical protein